MAFNLETHSELSDFFGNMDVLRKEIYRIYASRQLGEEILDARQPVLALENIKAATSLSGGCCVITNVATDSCFVAGGRFCHLLGISDREDFFGEFDSGDEDIIYTRIHPEDLVEKRMLEYELFTRMQKLSAEEKVRYKACCNIRIRNRKGEYMSVSNTTQIYALSPAGKMWLILCTYDLAPFQPSGSGIDARLVDNSTGVVIPLYTGNSRDRILTGREKDILQLARQGKPSKQIAAMLGISVHTVNRHRQNIIAKLSVGNIVEAITAASLMKLL